MPDIDWNRSWAKNLVHHLQGGLAGDHYGDQWGDPELREDLLACRARFLTPFIEPQKVAMEIGSGGGRWTQYLLSFQHLILVELNPEMFGYIKDRFNNPQNVDYIITHGSDIPWVPNEYIDFCFSFGVFVHLDVDIIHPYLKSITKKCRSGGQIVLQFSNKSKPAAARNPDFSDNNPEKMSKILRDLSWVVEDLDDDTLIHSSIIRAKLK